MKKLTTQTQRYSITLEEEKILRDFNEEGLTLGNIVKYARYARNQIKTMAMCGNCKNMSVETGMLTGYGCDVIEGFYMYPNTPACSKWRLDWRLKK